MARAAETPAAAPPARKRAEMMGKSFLAGCCASCGAVAVTNPIDVIRTRLELQGELARGSAQVYRGALHGLAKMVQQEGPAVLFRGLKPAFAFQIAVNGTRLGTFLPLKKWLVAHRDAHGLDEFFTSLVAGAGAGMVGACIGTPFQLIKTRMQAAARGASAAGGAAAAAGAAARQPYTGLSNALATIVKNEGLFGLYRGAHLNMLKIAVASAVQLAVFDGVKARLQRDEGSWGRRHPTAALFAAAMAAGLAVTAVIMPVDVINTRIWNQPVVNGVGTLYRNAWECASKTVAAEGPLALYKGATAHFMRAGPHTVLTLMLLTHLQRVLGLTPPQAAQQAARPGATATAAKS
ncbi:mitochondrial carrier [Micractinium conductrix]|uniref:Mitochondrial carrier n=1 Tax=Micractinium conductrix TaxID=554055 RepID=A0A2P6V2Q1_9CHLO|nr:mitochondrial carrier [Micractinium conductrix]|eukprot:PSC68368.1 mitochondrial carrier [Micractinium conductrix]